MSELKPPVSCGPRVPPYCLSDEIDLLWYHSLGIAAVERSVFGGMLERAEALSLRFTWPQEAVLTDDGTCIGYRSAITARPTAELAAHGGVEPDSEVLLKYARVSLRMQSVERKSPIAAASIALYFGDLGARWAGSQTGHGRIGALFHLTRKGKALIAEAEKDPHAISLPTTERIESIAIANKVQPKQPRTEALAVASRQAEDLERKARAVWHEVSAILRGR